MGGGRGKSVLINPKSELDLDLGFVNLYLGNSLNDIENLVHPTAIYPEVGKAQQYIGVLTDHIQTLSIEFIMRTCQKFRYNTHD